MLIIGQQFNKIRRIVSMEVSLSNEPEEQSPTVKG